jgi:hypothetical protein
MLGYGRNTQNMEDRANWKADLAWSGPSMKQDAESDGAGRGARRGQAGLVGAGRGAETLDPDW